MASAPFTYERRIAELAIQRAVLATELVRKRHIDNAVTWKEDRSPVSLADCASQALLVSAIRGAFPNDRIIAEESADDLRADAEMLQKVWDIVSSTKLESNDTDNSLASPQSAEDMLNLLEFSDGDSSNEGRVWTIDPIDGTMSYLDGCQYTVVAALLVNGIQEVGVVGCPRLSMTDENANGCDWTAVSPDEGGCMVSAVRTQGAHVRALSTGSLSPGRPIPYLSKSFDVKNLRIAENARSVRPPFAERHRIADMLGGSWNPMQVCSTQLRYVLCALGRCEVVTRFPAVQSQNAYVWDHAGGILIFSEVGGRTTDVEGRDIDCGRGRRLDGNVGTLGAPATVHSAVLDATRRVLQQFSEYKLNW
jgi:3'(2'), 5'-bisphosphate nucleotidase